MKYIRGIQGQQWEPFPNPLIRPSRPFSSRIPFFYIIPSKTPSKKTEISALSHPSFISPVVYHPSVAAQA